MTSNLDSIISAGSLRFVWREPSAEVFGPAGEFVHHGLDLAPDGTVVGFDQAGRELVHIDARGGVVRRVAADIACAHGIAVVAGADGESYWVADIGRRSHLVHGKLVESRAGSQVVKLDRTGALSLRLPRPTDPLYDGGKSYLPTSVAIDEPRFGGTGDVWVADGYGQSLVHRYSSAGEPTGVLDGVDGAGQFDQPHGLFIDRRRSEPELLIADRQRHRVQVFDLDGRFKRSYGTDYLMLPSVFATIGDLLVIGDLNARLSLVDLDDRLVGHLGEGGSVYTEPEWPNELEGDRTVRRSSPPGRFSSPHGLAASADGTIYVAEWRIAGRLVTLTPAS